MIAQLLNVLIGLPILSGLVVLALEQASVHLGLIRRVALALSLLCLIPCWFLGHDFDPTYSGFQFVVLFPWIPEWGTTLHLGVDGFSMPLILLTCLFSPVVILAGWRSIEKRVAAYMASFLFLQGLLCGVFAALDSVLFYLFWEALLIPMFLIIGIWGGPNRVYASIKFFLYTFLGSIFLLLSILYLRFKALEQGLDLPFDLQTFYQLKLSLREQTALFAAMLLAFAVKVPMWPVHSWLPDAHVEAPTGGSVILAAIMLKLGTYGFVRFILPITPDAAAHYAGVVITASLVAIVYIGLIALVQEDMKKLIAYSSIAHMGFVTLGFMTAFGLIQGGNLEAARMGIEGAYIQMISHGFISGALFLGVGVLYDRLHSRRIQDYGGVLTVMPRFGALMIFFAMANCGLPGTSGFVGEFLVILSAFILNPWYGFWAGLTLLLGAAYSLWMIKRVILGPIKHEGVKALKDLEGPEAVLLVFLLLGVLLLGLWPKVLLDLIHTAVGDLLGAIQIQRF